MKRYKIDNLKKKPIPKDLLKTIERKYEEYDRYNSKFQNVFLLVFFSGFFIVGLLIGVSNDFHTGFILFLVCYLYLPYLY